METDAQHRWHDLLPSHALGALEGEERRALEDHLEAGCAECATALAALRRDLELLAQAAPPVAPPAGARERLATAIAREATSAAPASPLPVSRLLGIAAALAVLLLGAALFWGAQERSRAEELLAERERLTGALAAVEHRLAQVEAERAEMVRQLSIAGGRELLQVQLAGLEGAPSASGRTLIDPSGQRALFYASGLPALPAGRTYQLWFIAGGTPVSAGVFATGERGEARVAVERVPPVDTIDAWAVTVEPAGGVPLPTGEMVLRG